MADPPDASRTIRRRRQARLAIGLNTGLALFLATALTAMINYLASRHYVRGDLSRSRYYELSDRTRGLLASLTNRIDVTVFFQKDHELFADVENLLKEYTYAAPRIRVEYVDPDRDLARTEELAARYNVRQANVVVFACGDRSKFVRPDDIMQYDYSGARLGDRPERVAFRGEQAFSSALLSVTRADQPLVCFLAGHGERDIEDFDRQAGYSGIAKYIREDNLEARPLVLGEARSIPEDCAVLVVAGPKKRISQPELDLVESHLARNGRAMMLVDALTDPGLGPLLEAWNIRLGNDLVVDATRTLSGRELFLTKYESHPITDQLRGITSIFYLPRSVEPLAPAVEPEPATADRPRVTVLARCSESGWAETDTGENPMKFDAARDRPGPVSVAVAVERGPGPGLDVGIRPTRLVVFGDSDFASNRSLTGGDVDLFMSALNWLLEREELLAIAPKPVEEVRLLMTDRDLKWLLAAVVVGIPALVALVGALVWALRRS